MARVSAASARAHTRKPATSAGCCPCCRTCGRAFVLVLAIFFAWSYKAIQTPPPVPPGTLEIPDTVTRVQLHDGRYLAYKERGIPKEKAKYKIINIHGFAGSRNDILNVSQAVIDELGIYLVGFDRAGYGLSDLNHGRTRESDAKDVIELADILELGPKFYITAISIGGYTAWTLLRNFPDRLAGVAMLCPVTNYWWSGIPIAEAWEAFRLQPLQDQIALSVSHYAPWLTYWWNTQNFFPKCTVVEGKFHFWSASDKKLLNQRFSAPREPFRQGIYESLILDMINMFGKWDHDPGDLQNVGVPVHIWHGVEDYLVPLMLQKYVQRRLPWVQLHEVVGQGHLLALVEGLPDQVMRTFLLGPT